MYILLSLVVFLLVALAGLVALFLRLRQEYNILARAHAELGQRFQGISDLDAEKQRLAAEIEAGRVRLQAETAQARATHDRALRSAQEQVRAAQEQVLTAREQARRDIEEQRQRSQTESDALQVAISRLRAEHQALEETADLRAVGFYEPRYDFASSKQYQRQLEGVRARQKQMLQARTAAACSTQWTVNGSLSEGRKQTNNTIRLALRAFNGECDAAVARVKYNNVGVMEARIAQTFEAINALIAVQTCAIAREYRDLKTQELHLAHEYQEKVQAEKEEQRRIREQMREEEIALREMEKARQDAEREEKRYAEALRKAREEVENAAGAARQKLLFQIEELQRKLEEARANKQRALARAQMTRSGHVYVISNVGSFGENVYKIGMTRRLDPLDRVRELGDASVPFLFDVHAVIYSDDAPALEATLHRAFQHRRINRVNERKEFFRVGLDEIAQAVGRSHGHGRVQFTRVAEAPEYRKTLAVLAQEKASGAGVPPRPEHPSEAAPPPRPAQPPSPPPIPAGQTARTQISPAERMYTVLGANRRESPPVGERQLCDLARGGMLTPNTQIYDLTNQRWFEVRELPLLSALLPR